MLLLKKLKQKLSDHDKVQARNQDEVCLFTVTWPHVMPLYYHFEYFASVRINK